ncbi:hypothetical protein BUALT_Bualt17G0017000 [Buddleja alternifolia]|uniref:SBP-type domain-containing protein n=1 Tax=Buddleja alternifolia TaxID=168488 RepID=A0AAV6W626_9LAMI|nr:hypothetical protein BUALT_Bualt17G0017000 [Buddleja alternifolia]
MNHSPEMEWNAKWDWDFVGFGSKAIESPKKLQLADWMIDDDGEIDAGSFNISCGGGNSGSDCGHVSSAKSSISASTDSSTKDGIKTTTPDFRLMSFGGFSGNFSKKTEMKRTEVSRTSPPMEAASAGSVEPLIGLKLGKRTYFGNTGVVGNVKSASVPAVPAPSTTPLRKPKSSGQNPVIPRCLVEGCNVDLSTAKEYHRKHRVCASHSKCPKVIIGGLERRFCQQCSRFHNLSEFDEKKRSCRRRLSDHNARRRKPQQETIQFNSTRLSSPYYGGRQQMSFLLNNYPIVKPPANPTWDSTCNSKFTLTKGYPLKSNGDGRSNEQLHIPGIKLPHAIDMHVNASNGLFSSKSFIPEVFNPGSKGSMISSHLDAAPEYGRALSLLSSNSFNSCGPESSIHQPMHENVRQPTIHAIPEGVPLSSDFWLNAAPQSAQPLPSNSNFQEIQLFKTPFEADFYSNILN